MTKSIKNTVDALKFKTVHIPLDLHQELKQEVVDLGPDFNLRKLIVLKLKRPISKSDLK